MTTKVFSGEMLFQMELRDIWDLFENFSKKNVFKVCR